MMSKQIKALLLTAFCILGMQQGLMAPDAPAADPKISAAADTVKKATDAVKGMTNTIVNAGSYVYSDAIALLAPMSDTIANPLWAQLKILNASAPEARGKFLDALVALASALVDNRERGLPADIANLHDAFDANISSDDFTMALTSPFKSSAQIAGLTAAAKEFAKQIVKKQDFKSIIALQLTALSSAQSVDPTVFATLADLVVRRLDDDEVVNVVGMDGVTNATLYEFQRNTSKVPATPTYPVNYFDASNKAVVAASKIALFDQENSPFSYDNSWPNIRSAIERICGSQVYRNYANPIDLAAQIGKTLNGTSAFRTEMLSRLVAPFTMAEMANCLDRLSSTEPFSFNDVSRFMNRVKLLRTLISRGLVKSTSDASKMINQRLKFVMQSKITIANVLDSSKNPLPSETSEALKKCNEEVQDLLDAMGSETYNDQIPEPGTVVALRWKNPVTGLYQYLAATPIVTASGTTQSTTWTFSANATDYIDATALFWSLSNADKIGFQCLQQPVTANPAAGIFAVPAPGLVCMDDVTKTSPKPTGVVGFASLTNDLSLPNADINRSLVPFKNTLLAQFTLEGTAQSAAFKSASFVAGGTQQSGYLSVGADGLVRTFSAATKTPSGVIVNGSLTPGPWEIFSLIPVEQFFIDLAKVRNYIDEGARIDFWHDAIKQSASDTSATAAEKRLAVVNELLKFIQSKPTRSAGLEESVLSKFIDAIDFSESMFSGVVLKEAPLRLALSKLRAEAEIPVKEGPLPATLPIDGQTVVLFIPSLSSSTGGRYLEIVQESADSTNPSYVLSATAIGPVADSAQFKVSVFRDSVSFESIAFPGNVVQIGVADAKYKSLAQEARLNKLRAFAAPLAKDNRGGATGFWDDENQDARLDLSDAMDTVGGTPVANGKAYLKCVINNSYLHVDNDAYVRVYDISPEKLAADVPVSLSSSSKATPFQIVGVKDLYIKLGKLQKESDDIARVSGYQNLIGHIETADDIRVLIDEIGLFFDSKRVDQKAWASFVQNMPLSNGINNLFKALKSSFKQALTNKALETALSNAEEKFVIAPVFSSQSLLKDGQIIALGWKNDSGLMQYVSLKKIPLNKITSTGSASDGIGDLKMVYTDVSPTGTQLEVGTRSPIDGVTHFRVHMHPNSNIATLESVVTESNLQAIANSSLAGIEDLYASPEYAQYKKLFDVSKGDVLGVMMGGSSFDDAISPDRELEEFVIIATDGFVSFKSIATGGFLSVASGNQRLVTIDPITVKKAGMNKAGVMVPTPRESFVVVPVSSYVLSLGDILTEPNFSARMARYLYYATGGNSPADRKIFLDSIAQEVATITASATSWNAYMGVNNAQAQASLNAIINQMYQDPNYQQELKDEIETVASQLDAGYVGAAQGGLPSKGSTVVLQTMSGDGKYIRMVPSEFNPSIFVLAAGIDAGDDLFDPACQLITDAHAGKLGFKSSATNKYIQSLPIDPVAARPWIKAKRNAATELTLTGTSFGSLGYYNDQLFAVTVLDPVAGTVQLKNIATGGYLSWVVGNRAVIAATTAPDGTAASSAPTPSAPSITTDASLFISSSRLRTIDPFTLKPFGATTNTLRLDGTVDTSNTLEGTIFRMIVFTEYYKMIKSTLSTANYAAKFDIYSRALPLITSDSELAVLLQSLNRMANAARKDKTSDVWKDFSSEDVQSKFMALLEVIGQNFADKLTDTKTPGTNGYILAKLQSGDSSDAVATYKDRFEALQEYLDTLLTPTGIDDFMSKLGEFMADRTDGVTINPARAAVAATATSTSMPAVPASLNLDFVTTVTTWLAEDVLYNKVIAKTNSKAAVTKLVDAASQPITFAEYINYLDTRWIGGKDRFTVNEKAYVLNHIKNIVSFAWLAQASGEDFDLGVAKELLLRARANQFRGDDASIVVINKALPQLVYPLIPGGTFMALITSLIQAVHAADPASADFTAARDALLKKAALWKTRVVLTGSGQLDLFNYASTLNMLLIDPLIAEKFTKDLTPILQEIATALSAQGLSFAVGGGASTSTSSAVSSGLTTTVPAATSSSAASSGGALSI